MSTVRRASAFALAGTGALAAPVLGQLAGVPFALEAAALPFVLLAVFAVAVTDGPVFDLFARPADQQDGRLRGLFGFAASGAILGGLAGIGVLPLAVFAASVLLVATGNLCSEAALQYDIGDQDGWFVLGGAFGAIGGFLIVTLLIGDLTTTTGLVQHEYSAGAIVALVAIAALLGGLVRSMLFPRDDPPVMFSVALSLWLLIGIGLDLSLADALFAVAVTAGVGVLSYLLGTASVEGMIAGIVLGLLAFVLGGPEWFLLLFAFFAIGGLSTKYQYDRKVDRGIAEDDNGARGGENVLANSTTPIIAVLGYAGASTASIEGALTFAFAGALATALGDTLSSEIGGVYDNPILITTFERVPAGTDGAVTWQGELAGLGGATIIAALGIAVLDLGPVGGLAVVGAGLAGMTVDSILGASIEGEYLGNEGVNFMATLAGGVVGGLVAFGLGLPLA